MEHVSLYFYKGKNLEDIIHLHFSAVLWLTLQMNHVCCNHAFHNTKPLCKHMLIYKHLLSSCVMCIALVHSCHINISCGI